MHRPANEQIVLPSASANVAAAEAQPLLQGKTLIAFLTLLAALGMLATNMYLASFPSIGHDLGTTPTAVRLTLTVFLVGFAFGQLVIGPLSDRYGRRPVLLAGLLVYAVASALCAVTASLEWMLAVRVLQAIGACTGSVVARAVARDLFQGDALTRSLGLVTTFTAAAPGFSPLIGGLIETFLGWRATFALLALVGAFAAAAAWLRIGETNHTRATHLSLAHAFAGYFSLMGKRLFLVPAAATTCAMGGLFAFFASSPTIFIRGFGVPPALFGLIPCFTVFAVFAGGFSAQRLARKWPGLAPIVGGLALMIIGGGAMLAFALWGQAGIAEVIGPLLVFLFGMGIVNPLSTVAAIRPFPEQAGAASALVGFFQMAGGALGTVILNAIPLPILEALPAVMLIAAIIGLLAAAFSFQRA
ncbi:MAG TPA: multidrug effflux MFS transporter [Xanthobacteraceae bacterium]|nr:multidrug effflux MFS transporter [Xanthobacteraceae bacterium]